MSPSRGFSLVEILVVVGIMALLASVIVFSGTAFRQSQLLHESVQTVLATLTVARSRTLSSVDYAAYGVQLESDRITVFQGTSWPGSEHEVTLLPSGVTLTPALAGGATAVVYERLTGATEQAGTITLALTTASSTRTIQIEATGLAWERS